MVITTKHGKRLKLILAEDMHLIRGALVALLAREQDMQVVAELDRGDAIVDAAIRTHPDVAIIDINLPGLDGISAAQDLRAAVPSCSVLMLTGMNSPGILQRALSAQVSGLLLKDSPPAQLAATIRRVAQGQRIIDPELAATLWERSPIQLTQRELEVLQLAADGAEPEEISEHLHITVGTVRNYLTNTVSRLNARNRLDAVRIARDNGWLY